MNGPKGINSKINASGPFMAQLVDFCVRYRATWVRRGYNTPIMNRLIFAKFKALVGGNVRVLLSGGAPLAEESHQFIRTALCTAVHQGNQLYINKIINAGVLLFFGAPFLIEIILQLL